MDKFTKKELDSIWRWVHSHSEFEWYLKLANQVESMIDNYCEHEEHEEKVIE